MALYDGSEAAGEEVGPGGEARSLSRRDVLARSAGLGLGLAFAGSLDVIFGGPARAASTDAAGAAGYGPLVADPKGRLALPRGFSYQVVAEAGVTKLVHGGETPGLADGSASFRGVDLSMVLITNHEISTDERDVPPVPALPGLTYDEGCPGGTTSVVLDQFGDRRAEYVSLAGTDNNCAGGVTPWDTWLSCEETESRTGEDGRKADHGYVFEVDPFHPHANHHPRPIKALGRFAHEAVAVDPRAGRLYLTEDAAEPNGLLYRFTPPAGHWRLGHGALRRLGATSGVLAALRAYDRGGDLVPDLSVATRPGTRYRVAWVTVPDRDARELSVRKQFAYRAEVDGRTVTGDGPKVTRSRKLEGMWWGDGGVYFVSSYAKPEDDGSPGEHAGQVWFLNPRAETVTLVLRYAPRRSVDMRVDGPDNITVSPYGGVVIAEDGEGRQHLLGATPRGETFFLARNEAVADDEYSEFTGPNFSPDRKTLFANVQTPGTTYAITGPWRRQG